MLQGPRLNWWQAKTREPVNPVKTMDANKAHIAKVDPFIKAT